MDSTSVIMDGDFIQWPPTDSDGAASSIRSTVTLAGFVIFLPLAVSLDHGGFSVVISVLEVNTLLISVCLLAVFVLVHELIHAALFAAFGAKPRYGMARTGGVPYFFVSAAGARLHKNKLLLVVVAPTVVLTAIGIVLMFAVPSSRAALVLALTMHLWGCICDMQLIHLLTGLPKRTEIECMDNGIRVYVNC
jgi:hypothetical protein